MSIDSLPGLETGLLGHSLFFFDTLDSTNNYCKEHASRLPDGAVVIAGRQTAAKGSRGRSWEAGPGQGLFMTALCKSIPAGGLPILPLLAGIAVSRALEFLCGIPFPIKWSNDVLCGEKKVCGILCEGRTGGEESFAVIGVGVNLLQNQEEFLRYGLVYAQSLLLATGKEYDFLQVSACICNQLEPLLLHFREYGFDEDLQAEYKWRCVTLGRQIRLSDDRVGTAVDLAADGSLLCNIEGRLVGIAAGEVSVRGLYGYV